MTKLLWNAIGYHQPNKSTNRTVCALGLQLDCVVGQLQGTVNMSCLGKWTVSLMCMCYSCAFCQVDRFFLMYNRCLVSFSNFVVVLITGYDDFALSNSLGNHSRD